MMNPTKKPTENLPAFPVTPTDLSGQIAPTEMGMTLRDYFAAKALVGLIASPKEGANSGPVVTVEWYVEKAFVVADAMLKARRVS